VLRSDADERPAHDYGLASGTRRGQTGLARDADLPAAGRESPTPVSRVSALFAHLDALQPVPPTSVCLSVYGGPRVALVQGHVKGRRVRAWLNRKNGCEIKRWDALGIVLRV
jgi:hypothetical protein